MRKVGEWKCLLWEIRPVELTHIQHVCKRIRWRKPIEIRWFSLAKMSSPHLHSNIRCCLTILWFFDESALTKGPVSATVLRRFLNSFSPYSISIAFFSGGKIPLLITWQPFFYPMFDFIPVLCCFFFLSWKRRNSRCQFLPPEIEMFVPCRQSSEPSLSQRSRGFSPQL